MDGFTGPAWWRAGVCIVIITVIIPYGVFSRYVLNSASSWPEPMAVLLMIVLSFVSAASAIANISTSRVGMLPSALTERRVLLGWLVERRMLVHQPVHALVRHQARAGDLAPEHR